MTRNIPRPFTDTFSEHRYVTVPTFHNQAISRSQEKAAEALHYCSKLPQDLHVTIHELVCDGPHIGYGHEAHDQEAADDQTRSSRSIRMIRPSRALSSNKFLVLTADFLSTLLQIPMSIEESPYASEEFISANATVIDDKLKAAGWQNIETLIIPHNFRRHYPDFYASSRSVMAFMKYLADRPELYQASLQKVYCGPGTDHRDPYWIGSFGPVDMFPLIKDSLWRMSQTSGVTVDRFSSRERYNEPGRQSWRTVCYDSEGNDREATLPLQ